MGENFISHFSVMKIREKHAIEKCHCALHSGVFLFYTFV